MTSQERVLSDAFYTTVIFKAHSTVYGLRGLLLHSRTLKTSEAVMDTTTFRVVAASRERVDIIENVRYHGELVVVAFL